MSKTGRMFVVIIAVMVQVVLGLLYGFSGVTIPAWGCFITWCGCAAIICRVAGLPETV